jgi:hypothetical protein
MTAPIFGLWIEQGLDVLVGSALTESAFCSFHQFLWVAGIV